MLEVIFELLFVTTLHHQEILRLIIDQSERCSFIFRGIPVCCMVNPGFCSVCLVSGVATMITFDHQGALGPASA